MTLEIMPLPGLNNNISPDLIFSPLVRHKYLDAYRKSCTIPLNRILYINMNILPLKSIKDRHLSAQVRAVYFSHKMTSFFTNKKILKLIPDGVTVERLFQASSIPDKLRPGFFVLADKDSIAGISYFEKLPFESRIFKKNMGRLVVYIPVEADMDIKYIKKLIHAAEKTAGAAGFDHLSVKTDMQDKKLINSLELGGYVFVSGLTTYLYIKNRTNFAKWKFLYNTRPAEQKDRPALIDIAAGAFTDTRFYYDPDLDDKSSSRLYKEWIKNCFDKDWAESIFVAESAKKEVVGFITYKVDKELRKAGILKGGSGLSACKPNASGAYTSLLLAAKNDGLRNNLDFVEFTAQSGNLEILRIWNKFGLDPGRIELVFHKSI